MQKQYLVTKYDPAFKYGNTNATEVELPPNGKWLTRGDFLKWALYVAQTNNNTVRDERLDELFGEEVGEA
jgi:hypothetical protein